MAFVKPVTSLVRYRTGSALEHASVSKADLRETTPQIRVGPAIQSANPVLYRIPRGQDQHGRLVVPSAQFAQQRHAVAIGQGKIKQDDIDGKIAQKLTRCGEVSGVFQRQSSKGKGARHTVCQNRIIFDQQSSHPPTFAFSGQAYDSLLSLGFVSSRAVCLLAGALLGG